MASLAKNALRSFGQAIGNVPCRPDPRHVLHCSCRQRISAVVRLTEGASSGVVSVESVSGGHTGDASEQV